MATTLDQVRKDFESYRKICKRQRGVMLHADKYVEDIGLLLSMVGKKSEPRKAREKKADE